MEYRREIDGLRALAVLPVIFFHAGFEFFEGGFVGVDIFFVISGFLITSIILDELSDKGFSLINFYERRARRILPALFFMLLACIPFAYIWLLPDDLTNFGQALIAVPLFVSNILFWRQSDYFNAASELNPLLHTWSLAVEEQYYLLFPIFLIVMWRLGRRAILPVLTLIFLVSFAIAEWGAQVKPVPAFFLLPTRGWEILLGAFMAFVPNIAPDKKQFSALFGSLATLGLFLMGYAIVTFDQTTVFPGVSALIPASGAALVLLFAHKDTLVGKLLGTPALVGLGLISFSTYLWHQPIFAFFRYRQLVVTDSWQYVLLIILSIALGFFSWRFIERPFRSRKALGRKTIFLSSLAFSAVIVAIGYWLSLPISSYDAAKVDDQDVLSHELTWESCLNSAGAARDDFVKNPCIYPRGVAKDRPSVLLIGDSHAQVLQESLSDVVGDGMNVILYAGGSCPPLFDTLTNTCADFHRKAAEYALQEYDVRAVVLAARWSVYTQPRRFVFASHANVWSRNPFGKDDRAIASAQQEIQALIQFWRQRHVPTVFVTDFPTNGLNISNLASRAENFGVSLHTDYFGLDFADYEQWTAPVDEVLQELSGDSGVFAVNSFIAVCGEVERCNLNPDGEPLLGDDNHASTLGARQLAQEIGRVIDTLAH